MLLHDSTRTCNDSGGRGVTEALWTSAMLQDLLDAFWTRPPTIFGSEIWRIRTVTMKLVAHIRLVTHKVAVLKTRIENSTFEPLTDYCRKLA